MRPLGITVVLVVLSWVGGVAQDKTKPDHQYDVKRCTPKVVGRPTHDKSPDFHFRRGEKYTHSPVVAYEILESGEIAHLHLERSSGVIDIDNYALKWVQEWKYNERPGCGVIESEGSITIDFSGGE